LQVPFIANYRKEYIEPELNVEDLWKVWEWDEKVSFLKVHCSFNQLFVQYSCPARNYSFSQVPYLEHEEREN